MNIKKNGLRVSPKARASRVFQLKTLNFGRIARTRHSLAAVMLASIMMGSSASHSAPQATAPGTGHGIGQRTAGPETWAKGRILVTPRAGLPAHEFARILGEHGGKARKIGQSNLYIVDLPANASEEAVAARLAHHPHLESAELDRLVPPDFIPNDPYYGSAWHLPKIGAPSAWDSSTGSGITVAILDTGVDGAHPDLAGQMVSGWNFYDNNSNTSDVYGHGTYVAGTVAAVSNNGAGVASVAGQSKIMPMRISDPAGYAYFSTGIQALIYATDHGARVANISYSGFAGSSSVYNAAQYMKNNGGLVTISAGNSGIDENYLPSTSIIAVSATDYNDIKTGWSSYGSFVSMSAPGVGIYTTAMGGSYGAPSGTSFSSPIIAGVIALIMAENTALPNTQVESLLYSTAVDLGDMGRDPYYGYGRVDATKAVLAAASTRPALDVQAPTISITSPHDGDIVSGLVPVDVSAADNIGIARVELSVNNSTVAIDSTAPFAFSWDSTGLPDGTARLVAYAFDAAGNSAASSAVSVDVSNGTVISPKDTTPPVVQIINPVAGRISGNNVQVSLSASDNSGAAGITQMLYIDGILKATGSGSTLGYNWNIRKVAAGTHNLQVVAKDAAGNKSSASVIVTVVK